VQVQAVQVARQIGGDVVIAKGVKAGDEVITEIPQALQPGGTVRVAGAEGTPGKGKGKGKGTAKQGEGKPNVQRPEG
jgi:hypothetical protein